MKAKPAPATASQAADLLALLASIDASLKILVRMAGRR